MPRPLLPALMPECVAHDMAQVLCVDPSTPKSTTVVQVGVATVAAEVAVLAHTSTNQVVVTTVLGEVLDEVTKVVAAMAASVSFGTPR